MSPEQPFEQKNKSYASRPIVEEFLTARRIDRGAADQTIQAYRTDLEQFFHFLPPQTSLSEVTSTQLLDFFKSLKEDQQKATSLARKASTLRQFFKFCCLEKDLAINPTEELEAPELPKRLPKALTEQQALLLLQAADRGIPYVTTDLVHREALQARDRAMVYLLYATGLRVSELMSLETGAIDLLNSYLRVTGKGGKQRITPFAPTAGQKLSVYIENHRPHLEPHSNHIFVNHRGFALTRQAFWKILKALCGEAGLSDTVSPHALRHTFATHLLHAGMNLRSLQMLLGHADLATTQIYTQVRPEHLKETVRKYHPRGE